MGWLVQPLLFFLARCRRNQPKYQIFRAVRGLLGEVLKTGPL